MFSVTLALSKRTKLDVQGFIERKILRTMYNREAEVMFWMTPELVENLLSFLDPASILALAKTHPLIREVLQSGINWTRFLERSCPKQSFTLRPRFQQLLPPEKPWWTHQHLIVSLMEHYAREALEPVIEILLLIGKPESHLLQLLDLICENFPSYSTGHLDMVTEFQDVLELGNHVKVACSCKEVHDVSPFGLELLEKVERNTDTCLQQVDTIRMWRFFGPILSAIKSRMLRPGGLIKKTVSIDIEFETREDVEAFLALAKSADSISFQRLVVIIIILIIIPIIFSLKVGCPWSHW